MLQQGMRGRGQGRNSACYWLTLHSVSMSEGAVHIRISNLISTTQRPRGCQMGRGCWTQRQR